MNIVDNNNRRYSHSWKDTTTDILVPCMHLCFVAVLTTGSVPMTVFRMFTKSRDVLYIRNNAHIIVDMWTSKPKYIISINEVIE